MMARMAARRCTGGSLRPCSYLQSIGTVQPRFAAARARVRRRKVRHLRRVRANGDGRILGGGGGAGRLRHGVAALVVADQRLVGGQIECGARLRLDEAVSSAPAAQERGKLARLHDRRLRLRRVHREWAVHGLQHGERSLRECAGASPTSRSSVRSSSARQRSAVHGRLGCG